MIGVVTRLFPGKGYGFIKGDDGLDRWFHASSVAPRIDFNLMREGMAVTFESVTDIEGRGNGLKARDVAVERRVAPRGEGV